MMQGGSVTVGASSSSPSAMADGSLAYSRCSSSVASALKVEGGDETCITTFDGGAHQNIVVLDSSSEDDDRSDDLLLSGIVPAPVPDITIDSRRPR